MGWIEIINLYSRNQLMLGLTWIFLSPAQPSPEHRKNPDSGPKIKLQWQSILIFRFLIRFLSLAAKRNLISKTPSPSLTHWRGHIEKNHPRSWRKNGSDGSAAELYGSSFSLPKLFPWPAPLSLSLSYYAGMLSFHNPSYSNSLLSFQHFHRFPHIETVFSSFQ